MPGKAPRHRARRVALALWAAFAFVTWNVVFDRQVYIAGVQFTREQIERYQRGGPVQSIQSAFSPRVGDAARRATLWGGGVLVAGLILVTIADRRDTRPHRTE